MTTLFHDVRFALRQLRKTPGFTATAVLTLALGIGANAAIFTLVEAVLMRNLPVAQPDRLVRIGDLPVCCVGFGARKDGDFNLFSTNVYEAFRKNAPEFEDLAAIQAGFEYRPVIARRDGTQEPARSVMGEFVSGNYFRTFGLSPSGGRLISDLDDVDGAPVAAVMSYSTWKNSYAGDPAVIGSTFFVNTKPVTVVGVAPEGFYGDRLSSTPPDFYLPLHSMELLGNVSYVHDPDTVWLYLVGRLKPGVSQAQLQTKLSGILRQTVASTYAYRTPENRPKLALAHVVLTPGGGGIQAMQDEYATKLQLLLWISGVVLLIACANIANLLLVRGMARKAEMSVRTALGAMRRRIVRQLLTESLVLAAIGGFAGLSVAYAGTSALIALAFPASSSLPIHASPSLPVLGFDCAVSLITGILFGIAPAWIAARAEPADALRSGSRTTAGGATLLQRTLIVAQSALSLILLVGAGLFTQSLGKIEHTNLRLDPTNRYIVHINPEAAGYSQHQVGELYRMIEERFHALPGVEKVGISTYSPMEEYNDANSVVIQGKPGHEVTSSFVKGNADYLDSVGTHVIAGRGILPTDTPANTTVAMVNESFVKEFFAPGENPIGHRFGGGPRHAAEYEIVGVVEDTVYTSVRLKQSPRYFVPILQRPMGTDEPIEKDEMMYAGTIILKTARPIPEMEALSRRTLSEINPNLSVVKFQTFAGQISDTFREDRLLARLTLLFGALALLLATIGLYGVTAYGVARRASEIGIRMALGAERLSVTAMVLRGAMLQTALGLAIGVPTALVCVRFIKAQLYEIQRVDSLVLFGSILTLLVAATSAGLIPARRAASIEPAKALRRE